MAAAEMVLCVLCEEKESKYTCPRCEANYCSSSCYKSPQHSDCSDSFYRDCVLQEMDFRNKAGAPQLSKDFLDALDKLQETEEQWAEEEDGGSESDLDSDDCQALKERLEGVDLDDSDAVWDKLTEEEKAEFNRMVSDGDAAKLLPTWQPWWSHRQDRELIQEVKEDETPLPEFMKNCPSVKNNIPSLLKITKSTPSESVKYTVMNILYAYAYTMKVFAGDWTSNTAEVAATMLEMSLCLSQQQNYITAREALESGVQRVVVVGNESPVVARQIRADVSRIILGPYCDGPRSGHYVLAALSDACELFRTASQKKKGEKDSEKEMRKTCFRALKKMEYLLSWANEYGNQL